MRPKKQKIEINDGESLQGMMQEVYNDACKQIQNASKVINEVTTGAIPEIIDDIAKIAKAKTDALKIKDSAIKIKLDVGKLQNEIIKHSGNITAATTGNSELVDNDAFDKVRDLIKADKEKTRLENEKKNEE